MPQNNKQPDNRSVVIWIIVFFVIAMIAGQQFVSLQGSSGNGEENKPLTTDTLITSEFLQAIEQDRVVSVVYDARNYTVTGTYYPAITAGETGADAYVVKPFNMEILLSRIQKLIEKKKSAVGPSRIEVTSLDQQFIEKAVSLVEDNLSNADFSVEELAAQLGISRGYLYRKLSQITGKSAIEFIRTIRMKRAQQLLVESQLQIAEVAYRMGYHSPKIFSKHFKSVFGVLPSEYVRSWKKE